uniref:Uncharacterized protein n=1 Tax=Glossina palpalis gambiensis TaxID=67801 RepID=A0A1B0BTK5_9MUSC
MSNKLLKDILKTREVLKAKQNLQKWALEKLDNKRSTPLMSLLTNDSIENHNNNNGGDDDDEHNNEINDVNNFDYKHVAVAADNDVAIMMLRCPRILHYQIIAASPKVVHNTEDPPHMDQIGGQEEEEEVDFHNAEEEEEVLNIGERSFESSGSTTLLNKNNSNNNKKRFRIKKSLKRNIDKKK